MASESASASATTVVGSTSATTIREIISTNQNLQIWKDFNLCIMTDNSQKAQCKHCFDFLSQGSNTTLRNHVTHLHCEVIKAQKNQNSEAGQTSMARDGSVFRYDLDYLREQFAGLVIQLALPFNHFDHEQTTRVFQNTMQPRYTHVSRSTLKRDAMKLWLAAKQEIIDSFGNINACVNLTTDVCSAPHGVSSLYNLYYTKYGNPTQSSQTSGGATSSKASGENNYRRLLNGLKAHTKKARTDPTMSSEYERYVNSDFVTHLHPIEFATFNVLDFEEDVFDDEVQRNEAIPLSDEEIALDASSEDTMSLEGPRYDYMMRSIFFRDFFGESTGGGSVGFCCYAVVGFDNLVVGYVDDVEIVVKVVIVRIVVDEIVLIQHGKSESDSYYLSD
nr:zinc finger, BED-type, phospholipase-like, homeodomain-like protein [Tanacetum cinerariifolium]